MHTFEIFTDSFSKQITAVNMMDALVEFYIDHPHLRVVRAEDIEARNQEIATLKRHLYTLD